MRKKDDNHELFVKIMYASCDECEYFTRLNMKLCERAMSFCERSFDTKNIFSGTVVVILTPTFTCVDAGILSVKYDLTVSLNRSVLHHKRFCINVFPKLGIFVLPEHFKRKLPKNTLDFYITEYDGCDTVTIVPVNRFVEKGMYVERQRNIDDFCDGRAVSSKIEIPKGVTPKSLAMYGERKRNA